LKVIAGRLFRMRERSSFGTDQDDSEELIRDVVPVVVSGSDDFAIVAPGIGEKILGRWLFLIESEPRGFTLQVNADEGLWGFSVEIAMDRVRHEGIFRGEVPKSTRGRHPKRARFPKMAHGRY
jgi:hypothetical protein